MDLAPIWRPKEQVYFPIDPSWFYLLHEKPCSGGTGLKIVRYNDVSPEAKWWDALQVSWNPCWCKDEICYRRWNPSRWLGWNWIRPSAVRRISSRQGIPFFFSFHYYLLPETTVCREVRIVKSEKWREQKKRQLLSKAVVSFGSPCWTRTNDLRINRPWNAVPKGQAINQKPGSVFRFWRPSGYPANKTVLRKDGFFPGFCPYSPQFPREISPPWETNGENPTLQLPSQGITEHYFRPKLPKIPSFSVSVAKRKE